MNLEPTTAILLPYQNPAFEHIEPFYRLTAVVRESILLLTTAS
jgi:hypothetical protein